MFVQEKQQQQLRGAKTRLYEERNTVSGRRAEHELRAELWEINMVRRGMQQGRPGRAYQSMQQRSAANRCTIGSCTCHKVRIAELSDEQKGGTGHVCDVAQGTW